MNLLFSLVINVQCAIWSVHWAMKHMHCAKCGVQVLAPVCWAGRQPGEPSHAAGQPPFVIIIVILSVILVMIIIILEILLLHYQFWSRFRFWLQKWRCAIIWRQLESGSQSLWKPDNVTILAWSSQCQVILGSISIICPTSVGRISPGGQTWSVDKLLKIIETEKLKRQLSIVKTHPMLLHLTPISAIFTLQYWGLLEIYLLLETSDWETFPWLLYPESLITTVFLLCSSLSAGLYH